MHVHRTMWRWVSLLLLLSLSVFGADSQSVRPSGTGYCGPLDCNYRLGRGLCHINTPINATRSWCVCQDGWHGVDCELSVCNTGTTTVCSGRGTCAPTGDRCVCPYGYDWSLSCAISRCDDGTGVLCSGQGICSNHTCICNAPYTGTRCEQVYGCLSVTSPSVLCNGHGKCGPGVVLGTSACTCDVGWSGTTCEVDACATRTCSAPYGRCTPYGCVCITGYGGLNCEYGPVCPVGYSGRFCNLTTCISPGGDLCSGSGTCSTGNVCSCDAGYQGRVCQIEAVAPECRSADGTECSGRGICVHKHCICNAAYSTGSVCQYRAMCVNGGTMVFGDPLDTRAITSCLCPSPFTGLSCEVA